MSCEKPRYYLFLFYRLVFRMKTSTPPFRRHTATISSNDKATTIQLLLCCVGVVHVSYLSRRSIIFKMKRNAFYFSRHRNLFGGGGDDIVFCSHARCTYVYVIDFFFLRVPFVKYLCVLFINVCDYVEGGFCFFVFERRRWKYYILYVLYALRRNVEERCPRPVKRKQMYRIKSCTRGGFFSSTKSFATVLNDFQLFSFFVRSV